MGLRFKPERMAAVAALTLFLASCGGGGGSSSASSGGSSQASSAARIFSLTPPSVPPGSNDFTLVVNGTNFRSDSVVLWNDTPKPSTFINSTQVNASIPKADVATGVNVSVRVNSASAGAASDAMVLKVEFPKPTIVSLSKASAQVNDLAFTLAVNGSNFFNGAHVQWDGIDRVTQFVNANQITAQILAADLTVGGSHTIRVSNPSPNAGISDGVSFFVQVPKPTITSISPDPVYAGAAPYQQFTISGTNFLPTTRMSFDGQVYGGNLMITGTQITFAQPTPRRLGPLEIKVSNDDFGTQTSAKTVTLIGSGSGIQTTSIHGPLLTDDLQKNVYGERTGSDPAVFSYDVAVYFTCVGISPCTPATLLISPLGTPLSWPSYVPTAISADARYIAYEPQDPHPTHTNYGPQYVYDSCTGATSGCAPQSYRITVPTDGSTPDDVSGGGCGDFVGACTPRGEVVSISGNGRYVAFQSQASNLILNDTNGALDVFFRDMCLGAPAGCSPTTVRIAANASTPAMSQDGRFVFYLQSGANGGLYAYDTCIGQGGGCVPGAVLVSIDANGASVGSGSYTISRNGRYVAFATSKTYARDTCLGAPGACTPTTVTMITTKAPTSIAPDGKHIAVETLEDFADPADTQAAFSDVYVISTCLGASGPCTQTPKRISLDAQGIQTSGSAPQFTPDGARIVYVQGTAGNWVITEPLTLP